MIYARLSMPFSVVRTIIALLSHGGHRIMEVFIVIVLFMLLALTASRWGFDSISAINSSEWEKRRQRAFSF